MRREARRLVRIAIAATIALVTGCRAPAPHEPARPPLNVVLLLADDWRHDTLGAAGHPVVRTPNLDRLAAGGVRFTHAYVTTAICGVSRASILTGQWMSRHGCRGFDLFRTPWTETYPGVLRANGDWVGHVGKWHNGAFPSREYDFGEGRITPTRHWIPQPDGTAMHVTRRNGLDALDFLRTRPEGRPFCLTVAFFAPHAEDGDPRQYLPQPESLADYRDAEIALPPTATDEAFRALPPFLANERQEGRRRWRWRFDTTERYRESMRNYFRLVTEVDAACGAIVAELERQGELDRTLVVFTTDNGYFHGEHGLADKWYPFEEAIRVPLVVRDPRLAAGRRGTTVDEISLNVDLAPTILAAAGCEVPPGMQGRDLSPLYLDESPTPWRTDFLYEHPTITGVDFIPSSRAVVRRDRKLIEWPDFGVDQLFDLTADPGEVNDLAADPGWAAERAALRRRMVELEAAAR